MSASGCREDHFAWFVIDAVGEMDLDAFYAAYRADGRSRPAYDPAMMVALLLYAYARGIRSSRVIERACEEDVAFRVIAAQQRPDHATIARFVERHQEAIAGLFGEVLTLCARSGLAKVGVIAVDGTKVQAQREPQREPRLRAARARDRRGGDRHRRGRGRASTARRAATSCRRSFATAPGAPRLAARSQEAAWRRSAPRTRSRCRAIARSALKEAKRRLEEELWSEVPRQPRPMRRTGRAGG